MLANLEVVQLSRMTRKKQSFPCYGMQWGASLYLYPIEENLVEFYHCPPTPNQVNEARMYGGRWSQESRGVWRLEWTEEAVRDFYLNNILIHELGHLVDLRNTGYVDRERYAEWFALEYGYKRSRTARGPKEDRPPAPRSRLAAPARRISADRVESRSAAVLLSARIRRACDVHQRIQAARAKTFQVERHVLEAQRLELRDQAFADSALAELRQRLERHFQPGHVALVIADAQRSQAHVAQKLLGRVDHRQSLGRDLFAIGHAAAQAGRRRLVPGRQIPLLRPARARRPCESRTRPAGWPRDVRRRPSCPADSRPDRRDWRR